MENKELQERLENLIDWSNSESCGWGSLWNFGSVLSMLEQAYELGKQEANEWISVEDNSKIPLGDWLFCVQGGDLHTGKKNETFIVIGGHFSWDCEKIIAYRPLPTPPNQ